VDSNDSPKIVNIKKRDSNAKLSPFYVETKDFLKPSNRLINNNNNNNNNNSNNSNNTSSSNMSNSLNSFSNGARGNNFKRISINLEQVEIPNLITDTTATTTTTTTNNNTTTTTNNNNDRLNDKRNSLAPKEIAMMENSSYYGIRNEKLVKIVHK